MRTLLVLGVVVVVGIGGYYLLGGHVSQWMRDAKGSVNQMSSDGHLIGMNEEALSQANEELKKLYVPIYEVSVKVAKLEAALKIQNENLAKEEKIFKRAKELLESSKPGSKIMIGQVSYAWENVNEDVLKRVGNCKVLRSTITANEQSLSKLHKAYEDGMEMIRQKKDDLRRKKIEFEAERAELAALRAQAEINEVIGKVYSAGDIKTELGEARKAFDDRLNQLRANAEFDQKIGLSSGVVATWNAEIGIPQENAVDAIKAYFDTNVRTPAPKPSVGEAIESLPEKK